MSDILNSKLKSFIDGVRDPIVTPEVVRVRLYDYIIQAEKENEPSDSNYFDELLIKNGFDRETVGEYSTIYSAGVKVLERKAETYRG